MKRRSKKFKLRLFSLRILSTVFEHLFAVGLAALVSSLAVFSLYTGLIEPSSDIKDFVYLYIPLFSAAMILVTLYSSISESKQLAKLERDQSVRPLIFLELEFPPTIVLSQAEIDRMVTISIFGNNEWNELNNLYIENQGLGTAVNVRFYWGMFGDVAAMEGSVHKVLAGQGVAARCILPADKKHFALFSVFSDLYGNTLINQHIVMRSFKKLTVTNNRHLEKTEYIYNEIMSLEVQYGWKIHT